MRKLALALALCAAPAAQATPADWTSYLCETVDGVRLVRVNEKDRRVVIDDRDVKVRTMASDRIAFEPPRGGTWVISKPSLALETLRFTPVASIEKGTCRIVDD